jgi:nucleoside-diphosphate-sugar epimerase
MKLVVTGGSGLLGRQVVADLSARGYDVLSLDRKPHPDGHKPAWVVDLLEPGNLYQACAGRDGVVHLAAHIAPGLTSDCATFNDNVSVTYNVLKAATDSGIKRIAIASSVAAYGLLYGPRGLQPEYLPIDEHHPARPVDPYGLSKVVGEALGESFARKPGTSIFSLRLPGINYDPEYERVRRLTADPAFRAPGCWSYIDVRDASLACVLAIESGLAGHHVLNVACVTSNMRESTGELAARLFPGVTVRNEQPTNWSGIDSSAIETLLGFRSRHRWEDAE